MLSLREVGLLSAIAMQEAAGEPVTIDEVDDFLDELNEYASEHGERKPTTRSVLNDLEKRGLVIVRGGSAIVQTTGMAGEELRDAIFCDGGS